MTKKDDIQIEQAILDFLATQPNEQDLISQLKSDEQFYVAMGKALSEVAMFICSSTVITDENEFKNMKDRVLFESRNDVEIIRKMRRYYLSDASVVDISEVLQPNTPDMDRYTKRMADFLAEYNEVMALIDGEA